MRTLEIDSTRHFLNSTPSLIAWFSVVLLAAAWGRTLDADGQRLWALAGAFGLTAAVGLSGIEKARGVSRRRSREGLLHKRLKAGLAGLTQQNATVDAVSATLERLSADAARHRDACQADNADPLFGWPLDVMPVAEGPADAASDEPHLLAGRLRQISSRVIVFEHPDPFATRTALLGFRLSSGEQVSFVVELMWTKPIDGELVTSAEILAVGSPE